MAACRFFRPHMRRRKLSWLPPYDSNVPSSGNSGAPSPRWLDGNEMVETVGLEPTSACLQNRRADPALPPNNPGIFRTKWCLKMESNHRRARLQRAALPLSYPGNRGADGGNRTRVAGVALQGPANGPRPHFEMVGVQYCVSEVIVISASSLALILRSIARAMRLEGWQQATTVQAAILRDASLCPPGKGLLLRMRTESMETTGFMESIPLGVTSI
jgi:hypothetical protein